MALAHERTKVEKEDLSQFRLPLLTASKPQLSFSFPPLSDLAGFSRFVLLQSANNQGPQIGWRIAGLLAVEAIAEQVTIINTGPNIWRLGHRVGSAEPRDRIVTPSGADWTLAQRQFAVLWYDSFIDRWRILESNGT